MCFGEDRRTELNLSTNYIKRIAKIGKSPLLEPQYKYKYKLYIILITTTFLTPIT